MKNLVTLLTALFIGFQATASENTKFVAVDQTLESNLCVVAAKQGYSTAMDTAKSFSNFNKRQFNAIECNGKRIAQFAKFYQSYKAETPVAKPITYRFKTLDDSVESRMCAVAAEEGLAKAVSLGGKQVKGLVCNGKSIAYFARMYKNS